MINEIDLCGTTSGPLEVRQQQQQSRPSTPNTVSRMSSRRKSTTPCMVPPQLVQVHSDQEMMMEDDNDDILDLQSGNRVSCEVDLVGQHQRESQLVDSGGYECKYCRFQTSELQQFTLHLDTEHQDLVANTSYSCTDCDYHTKRYCVFRWRQCSCVRKC